MQQVSGMIRLSSACYALADLTPDRRFFLSARKAAGIIGMDKMTAHRWLTSLCADGYLELLERGVNRPGGKANRYRYTGPTHPDDVSASDENGTTS